VVSADEPPFRRLDFLYTPSRDVGGDLAYFRDVLGGRVVFAVEDGGTRVAAIELAPGSPSVLLTDHVEGDRPILVFRVDDLEATMARLEAAGWAREHTFEIPHGPICSFRTPGGHRIALYELTRPEAATHFDGRLDF
jgi:catechol 2,3-dioxygenase-like lactoylglutathione lyase family enzyme